MQEGPTSVEEELMEFLSIEEGFGVSTVPWGFGAHLISQLNSADGTPVQMAKLELQLVHVDVDSRGAHNPRDAVACRLAVQTALATTGTPPLELQKALDDLDSVHDPRVLHTLAVLARDLTPDEQYAHFSMPSEMFVSHVLHRETTTPGQQLSESDSVATLQRHLEGLEEAHWWLLAPLLRNRALRPPIDQRSWWISLLLRAIDAPALGILRKQDALALATGKGLTSPKRSCIRLLSTIIKSSIIRMGRGS